MAQPQVIQGSLEEFLTHEELKGRRDLLLIVPVEKDEKETKQGKMLKRGMFPQLRGLTEEDFESAEWHGEDTEV